MLKIKAEKMGELEKKEFTVSYKIGNFEFGNNRAVIVDAYDQFDAQMKVCLNADGCAKCLGVHETTCEDKRKGIIKKLW